jgi:hypothetical protein
MARPVPAVWGAVAARSRCLDLPVTAIFLTP